MKKKRKILGFTLVELLIAISIIGLLTAVGASNYLTTLKKGRDGKRKADLQEIRGALEMYRSDKGSYPPGTIGQSFGWQTFIQGGCSNEVYNALIGGNYMKQVPDDPGAPAFHYFYYKVNDNDYYLASHLENTKDPSYTTQNFGGCTPFTAHYVLRAP